MLKLLKKATPLDIFFLILIIGLTVLQVYCTMTLADYVQGIIRAITYLNYHDNPSLLGSSFMTVFQSPMINSDWTVFSSYLHSLTPEQTEALGLSPQVVSGMASIADASPSAIWFNGGMMILCACGTAACQFVISFLGSLITANLATTIRHDLNEKVSHFSLAEINHFSTASLVTRATNDVQQVQMAAVLMMQMVFSAPITAIWGICKIQASSMELTWATAITILLLLVFIIVIMLLVMPKFQITQKLLDRLNGITRENLSGIRVVRASNAERFQEDKAEKATMDLTKTQIFTGKLLNLFSPFMSLLMNGISLTVYWLGALLINQEKSDYATITSFMVLASEIIMAFMMLMMMFILLPRAIVSAKRINEVLNTPETILDPVHERPLQEKGTVEFRDVSFRYPDAQADVLSHISFKAAQGSTVAFIGSTGSGKSTLINLISRLYDVSDGSVLVDGVDVRDMRQKTLRSLVGFVPQKGLLFTGTVKSNLALGKPDLTDEEAKECCVIAEADEFVSKMEKGYDSPIAQGGTNVSGGQRQRLCIARALAIHPEIIVFDDSFSALDFKTDRKVRDNLREKEKDATKIIVAQRIGTILDADQIIVLEDGKAVGIGKHEELLKTCPTYREIALSQLSEEELGL
jgi:ATP-binding cassette subfamily B multidrug efflux pump